jgi:phosphoribosylformylglycinamidine synthase PurS subunit
MIRAQVIVRPRASIFDPQGDAVQRAIQHLGVSAVKQAHVGKFIELELEATDVNAARAQIETICQDLLSNPVIEDYTLTLEPVGGAAKQQSKPAQTVKKNKAPAPKTKVRAAITTRKPAKKAKAAKPKKAAKRPAAKASKVKKARKK